MRKSINKAKSIINSQVLHTKRSGLKRKIRNPTCTKKYYIQKRARFEFDFFFFLKVRNRSRCANQSQALHSRGFAHIPNSSTQVVTATQWSKSKYILKYLPKAEWFNTQYMRNLTFLYLFKLECVP